MAENGGYRAPARPAAVSGPGAMSQRTDRPQIEALGENYGDQVAMGDLRAQSPIQPMRKTTVQPSRGGGGGESSSLPVVTGLGDPSTMPDVPITDGADMGPGSGLEALGLPQTEAEVARADVAAMHPGLVEALVKASMNDTATPSFKKYVRQVLANR
jgi:hypothetical protein